MKRDKETDDSDIGNMKKESWGNQQRKMGACGRGQRRKKELAFHFGNHGNVTMGSVACDNGL